jgi:predicted flap endonuclease-1-like 5' DNA nuclease
MTKLADIEGIGATYATTLAEAGVESTEALLAHAGGRDGRRSLAASTGISESQLLTWVNHADLFRVDGIGEEYADLLHEAGVDTVPELAQRSPENLHAALSAANEQRRLVRALPAVGEVQSWTEQAKSLPAAVSH